MRPAAGGQLEQHLVGLDGIVVEVRAAADDVGSGGQRVASERPVVGARWPGDGPADRGPRSAGRPGRRGAARASTSPSTDRRP